MGSGARRGAAASAAPRRARPPVHGAAGREPRPAGIPRAGRGRPRRRRAARSRRSRWSPKRAGAELLRRPTTRGRRGAPGRSARPGGGGARSSGRRRCGALAVPLATDLTRSSSRRTATGAARRHRLCDRPGSADPAGRGADGARRRADRCWCRRRRNRRAAHAGAAAARRPRPARRVSAVVRGGGGPRRRQRTAARPVSAHLHDSAGAQPGRAVRLRRRLRRRGPTGGSRSPS